MKNISSLFAVLSIGCLLAGCATKRQTASSASSLPPIPANVIELKFGEFFVSPVGPRGLVLSEKLTNLNGKRVRLLGYMVRQDGGQPGKFLFTAIPVQLHDHDAAFADDLPPATVHVSVPDSANRAVPYYPGLMLLTGILSVGHFEEADGRTSLVRLAADPPDQRAARSWSLFRNASTRASLAR